MRISIITATYNSQQFIQDALDSYTAQDYEDKEWLLIDGASRDATVAMVKGQLSEADILLCEPDQGIYDALNKGIQLAKGEVIGILHSDDVFAAKDVLKNVAALFQSNPALEAVYGDLQYVDRNDISKVIRNWQSGMFTLKEIEKGWMPPHPTLFIKKECFVKYGDYSLSYHSAADYDLILRFLYKYQIKVAYLPQVLVKMRVGGLSNKTLQNRWNANVEDRRAMKENGMPHPLWSGFYKPLRKISQFWKK